MKSLICLFAVIGSVVCASGCKNNANNTVNETPKEVIPAAPATPTDTTDAGTVDGNTSDSGLVLDAGQNTGVPSK